MIYITLDTHDKLIEKDIHEECGFVIGSKSMMVKVIECSNKSKDPNQFKIGLLDKLRLMYSMIKDKNYQHAPYHVHKNGLAMSQNDVKYADAESVNVIICKNRLKFFKVILTKNDTKVPIEMKYEIVI